jgi:hypothetical protein
LQKSASIYEYWKALAVCGMVQLQNTDGLKMVLGTLTLRSKVCCNHIKVKEVKQSLFRPITGPEGSRRFRLPHFGTIGT